MDEEQLRRYREQLKVPGMTKDGQSRLLASRVAIFGVSGQGALAAKSLAQAGVGELVLVDPSLKALSHLKRALKDSTRVDTKVTLSAGGINEPQTEKLLLQAQVILDGLDDWQEKLSLSDICMSTGRPLIHSGVDGFRFQLFAMLPGKSACLRCALPIAGIDDVPLKPLATGKIQAILEMVGAWQSIEAIKLAAKIGATQGNELIKWDGLSGEFEIVRGLDPQRDCPDCGQKTKRRRRLN